jgi:DNA-binding PadR family transcriptional regulator
MSETRGINQEKECQSEILIALSNNPNGLLAARLLEQSSFSPKTVYKNLRILDDNKLIDYVESKTKRGEMRRPIRLTVKGKQEATKRGILRELESLSPKFLEQVLLNGKLTAILDIKDEICSKINPDLRTMIAMSPSDNEEIKRFAVAIENDLRSVGFSDTEIFKLWILDNGSDIVQLIDIFGSPSFCNLFSIKADFENVPQEQKDKWIKWAKTRIRIFTSGEDLLNIKEQ